MIELRPYQKEAIDYLANSTNPRDCLCLPTGAGKAYIAVFFTMTTGKKTLILVHRTELLEQMERGFVKQFGYQPALIQAGAIDVPESNVYIGMVETLARRPALLERLRHEVDVLIIDECHLGNFLKLIDGFKRVIGFTATPQLKVKGQSLQDHYNNIYIPTTIDKLIDEGNLLLPVTYAPKSLVDAVAGMKLETGFDGEYTERSMTDALMDKKVFADAVKEIQEKREGRTIVFCAGVVHSKELTKVLCAKGMNAHHLDGGTLKAEREYIKEVLHNDPQAIVCNCGVLTIGFDEPRVKTIVLNRLTTSENLYIQMVGRGSRPCDEIGKSNFIVLDLYGNSLKHDLWQAPRDWSAKFRNAKSAEPGEAPVKICPQCGRAVAAAAVKCECGYVFEAKAQKVDKTEEELVVVPADDLNIKMLKFKKALMTAKKNKWDTRRTVVWYFENINKVRKYDENGNFMVLPDETQAMVAVYMAVLVCSRHQALDAMFYAYKILSKQLRAAA